MNDQPPTGRGSLGDQRHDSRSSLGRPLLTVALLLAVLASFAFLGVTQLASASTLSPMLLPPPPPPCPNLTLIGARGSGESFNGYAGMGPAVDRMATVLSSRLATHRITVSMVGDPYPADSVSDLEPSNGQLMLLPVAPSVALYEYAHHNLDKYLRSIDVGINDAVSLAEEAVASCPNSKLVLAGYSQGAMVVHQAELQLAKSGQKKVLRDIVGTMLLGDGDRVPYTRAKEFGTSLARAEGIRTYLHGIAPHDVELPTTTANICDAGDLVCDFNLNRLLSFGQAAKVHSSYAVQKRRGIAYKPVLASAANWLASKIIARR